MGLLITVEGGEFTGKTTVVVPGLVEKIKEMGVAVLHSREPGGTFAGEQMRKKIFELLEKGIDAATLAHLFNEARALHIRDVIVPFFAAHHEQAVVLLDRYLDSTRVYQGFEGGAPFSLLFDLEKKYVKEFFPNITIILYFPDEIFAQTLEFRRNKSANDTSRDHNKLDDGEISFHHKRQTYYLECVELSKQLGENREFILVNAAQPPEKVLQDAWAGIHQAVSNLALKK